MRRLRIVHLVVAAAAVSAAILLLQVWSPADREVGLASAAGPGMRSASSALARAAAGVSTPEERLVAPGRRLVRTGSLAIEVARYADAAENAVAIAEAHGGYLSGARVVREAGNRQRGRLTLLVKAAAFDAAFRRLKELGRVASAEIETHDATRAYADLETRLAVKRDAQARLLEILRGRTGKLSDLIEAERELSRLVAEAEELEGERRYLARQVELATIVVELSEPAAFLQDGAAAPLFEAARDAVPLLSRSASMMLYAVAAGLPWAAAAFIGWKLRKRSRVRRLIRIAEAE